MFRSFYCFTAWFFKELSLKLVCFLFLLLLSFKVSASWNTDPRIINRDRDFVSFSKFQKDMYKAYLVSTIPTHMANLSLASTNVDKSLDDDDRRELQIHILNLAWGVVSGLNDVKTSDDLENLVSKEAFIASMELTLEEIFGDGNVAWAEAIWDIVIELKEYKELCGSSCSISIQSLSTAKTTLLQKIDVLVKATELLFNARRLWIFTGELRDINQFQNEVAIAFGYINASIRQGVFLPVLDGVIIDIANQTNFLDTGYFYRDYNIDRVKEFIYLYKGVTQSALDNLTSIDLEIVADENSSPYRPTLKVSTTNSGTSKSPLFTASSFKDPDSNDFHSESWWGIQDADTGIYIFDSGWSSTHKTQFQVPLSAGLVGGKSYIAAVAYRDQDSAHSPGSFASFKTAPEFQVPEASFMRIPLRNYTHSTVPISSFFDHSSSNSIVRVFDGTEGNSNYGTFDDCYKQSSGQDFVFDEMRYVGDVRMPEFLCYNGHQGVDFAVPVGTPVVASADGYVIAKDNTPNSGGGCTVVINHGNGYATAYMHLLCENRIPLNATVKQGDVIASSGATGNVGAHLHLEVRSNCPLDITAQCPGTSYPRVDPYGYLGANVLWGDWNSPEIKENSDIQVSFIQPSSMDLRRNQLIKLFANVSNSGEIDTPITTLEFYASLDNGACGSGYKIGEVDVSSLNVGSSSTVSLYAISNDNWDNRRLTANVGSFSGEEDTEDNCLIGPPISISESEPVSNDFYLSNLSLDEILIKVGEQIDIEYDVFYSGNGSAEEYVSSEIYLSTDNQLDDSDFYVGKELSTVGTEDEFDGEKKSFTLPTSLESGEYYFLVVLDPDDQHGESSESNNFGVLSFTIEGTNDFSISEFSVNTNELYEWGSIRVDVTTKYQGNNRSTQRPVTGVYISEDAVFNRFNDQLVEQIDTGLHANHVDDTDFSSETDEYVSLRKISPGTWYLFAVADHNDNYSENDESNNVSPPIALTIKVRGDFSLSNAPVSVSAPAGGQFNVTLTSNYVGDRTEDTDSFIGCFVSDDQEWDEFDVYSSILNETELNTNNRSEQIVMDIRLPSNLFPSTQYLICVTDLKERHTEPNEVDNVISMELQIESGNDVFMDSEVIVTDYMLYRGELFAAGTYVSYSGLSETRLNGVVGIYLSKDGVFDAEDIFLNEYSFSLYKDDLIDKIGRSDKRRETIPVDIEIGEYYVLFVADHLNELAETNEFNNVAVSQKIGVEVQLNPNAVEPFLQKIVANGEISRIDFGSQIDTYEDWLISTAPKKEIDGTESAGAVYVFKKDSAGRYQQHQVLRASNPEESDFLGSRGVAIHGDTILVGAYNRENNFGKTKGMLYVYRLEGNQWTETQIIEAPFDYNRTFGTDVTLNDNVGAVSAPFGYANSTQSASERGTVHILNKNVLTDKWELGLELKASDLDGFFGSEITIDNDKLAVSNSIGGHYIFHKVGSAWLEKLKISNSHTKRGLVLRDNLLLVGHDLYEYNSSGDVWMKIVNLSTGAIDREVESASISLNKKTIVISEIDSREIYIFNNINSSWKLTNTNLAEVRASNSAFGETISFSSDGAFIFVGDPGARVKAYESVGAVYVYENKTSLDNDGDGINDDLDNCPTTPNSNQLDNDDDGEGNACDLDDDNDGVSDLVDNCQFVPNASQINTDGDSNGNLCDTDDDNDGLPDTWEIRFGLDPLNRNDRNLDSDGDGYSNYEEYLNGTNPTIPDQPLETSKAIMPPIIQLLLD